MEASTNYCLWHKRWHCWIPGPDSATCCFTLLMFFSDFLQVPVAQQTSTLTLEATMILFWKWHCSRFICYLSMHKHTDYCTRIARPQTTKTVTQMHCERWQLTFLLVPLDDGATLHRRRERWHEHLGSIWHIHTQLCAVTPDGPWRNTVTQFWMIFPGIFCYQY